MSRIVLALSGWKRSGKDTTADYLCNEYGFRRVSFAAKLKDMVASTYNVPREYMDSPTHKEMPLHNLPVIPSDLSTERLQEMFRTELRNGYWTPRALCILEGSVKRAVYSNYWVKQAVEQIVSDPVSNYVITDMRYKTEADTVKILFPDVRIMRINRFDNIDTMDPSERDMDDYSFDFTVDNRTSMESLNAQLDNVITSLSRGF
jgi:hypothetical protein